MTKKATLWVVARIYESDGTNHPWRFAGTLEDEGSNVPWCDIYWGDRAGAANRDDVVLELRALAKRLGAKLEIETK